MAAPGRSTALAGPVKGIAVVLPVVPLVELVVGVMVGYWTEEVVLAGVELEGEEEGERNFAIVEEVVVAARKVVEVRVAVVVVVNILVEGDWLKNDRDIRVRR